ncbi:MAG: hypothetical protein ACTJGH_00525 [Peptoniphilaceae bacterium]
MKKIIFDLNPLGSFLLSYEAYKMYFNKKYNKDIYIYTRNEEGTYNRIDELINENSIKNRVITFVDLGSSVHSIPFDDNIRVTPIDESLEEDIDLIKIVEELGERASWKNSCLKVVEVENNL